MQTTRGDATLRDALVISLHRESANDRMPWEDCKPAYLASGGLPAEESIAPDPAREVTICARHGSSSPSRLGWLDWGCSSMGIEPAIGSSAPSALWSSGQRR
jgi:hypothetical protein